MSNTKLLKAIGFHPKENTSGIFHKKYNGYAVEVDFDGEKFNFGEKITAGRETTQNFSQAENWVVLECVDRLLEKGYKPENIILEKKYTVGHGASGGWLDILVTRDDGSAYLMIECKTWGKEFDKELKKLNKDGGQLFTYFQQDKDTDIIMLYSSEFNDSNVQYRNEIIKIEEDYKQTGNVKDLFERWSKQTKANGVFDSWTTPYEFKSKALTRNDLKALKQADSSYIFNRFLEILRHNVVSDKPNAFNKIFTLFLCKIVDEDRNEDEQLHFQWIEGEDNHISFQKRLTDLYNRGMLELLEKKVTDVSDAEFDKRFAQVDDKYKEQFQDILTEIRLKKNNEFAIKEVYDDASFNENAKVVKEVVELLQPYQIRYNYRQQFLSDFFELLLTTGLKQESGQFFTPVPIARFIIRSLPILDITNQKIEQGNKNDLLPRIIDYSAGSGHFITESMEEVQKHIDSLDEKKFTPTTKRTIKKWKEDQFDWAEDYVYAIEKDYRLVKTAKVSCYLHGDGLAKVIHGDGLGDFATSTEFKGLLKEVDKTYPQDNKQFDVIVSNPPYSVSAFKGQMEDEIAQEAFDLYNRLTDQSSEIECLFIERTKQLLKDGGVAGIILPSSILSNTGIYTGAREIILKYFDILAIAELGSNTFMATGTNTVTLFLRRRNNADCLNIHASVEKLFVNRQDITINGIEKPLQKYIDYVWEDISFEDYVSLLQKNPNENIQNHEIFKEYDKKIKLVKEDEKFTKIIELEKEKLLYFILAYKQKVVLVKTGQKNKEKQFLGYEFSNRRGSEGIHPTQRSKTIDDCTQLYDPTIFDNPEKASTYIYKAFAENKFDCEVPENLKENVGYQNLADMLSFDRADFEKNISLSAKKKVIIPSRYNQVKVEDIFLEIKNGKNVKQNDLRGKYRVSRIETIAKGYFDINATKWTNDSVNKVDFLQKGDFLFSHINSVWYLGKTGYFDIDKQVVHGVNLLRFRANRECILPKYAYEIFNQNEFIEEVQKYAIKAANQASVNVKSIQNLKIPLPPLDIQQKIVDEIEVLEKEEKQASEKIDGLKEEINLTISSTKGEMIKLEMITSKIGSGATPRGGEGSYQSNGISLIRSQNIYDSTFVEKGLAFINEKQAEKLNNVTVEQNDILFNITGASIARCCIVEDKYLPARVNQHVSIIRTNAKAVPQYVQKVLVSPNIKNKLFIIGEGATSRQAITKGQLEEFKIPLPPLSEQQKIVAEIEKIEEKIKILETKLAEIPQQKEQVLKKYL